ncbi:MAG: UDP-N-acetylmuramate--L-alanine ligase [Bdellovibrionales bacterium]
MRIAKSKVHFIGVGGIGMSGLAELLKNMGAEVSGSDMQENATTERLKNLGVKVFLGHDESHITNQNVVVYSSAVPLSNVEIIKAKKLKIPIIARAEVLAEVMRLKRGIAIAGTHGKTTTTSMVASVFLHGKLDPTVVVGGRLDLIKSNSFLGHGEWLIAEADESDGSFLKLSPEIVVVTNIDNDHMEHFKTMDNLKEAFSQFAARIPFYGLAVVCGDDSLAREVFAPFNKRIVYYGFDTQNDYVLKGEKSQYEVFSKGKKLGSFDLNLPGRHNALNAMASIAAGLEAGLPFEKCAAGLRMFHGVDRRFQWKGEVSGVDIFDDYGHHPTEIAAVLQAFKEKYTDRRLVVLFQPHRYTRTKTCWNQFLTSFELADKLYLSDIYSAGETPIEGYDIQRLVKEIKSPRAEHVGPVAQAHETIHRELKPQDVFVTLGAGDVWKVGMHLLKKA